MPHRNRDSRRPHDFDEDWDIIIEYVPSSMFDDEIGVSCSAYQDLQQRASILGDRVNSLEKVIHLQKMLLQEAMRHANTVRGHLYDTDFVVPGEIVVFFMEHGLPLPTADEEGIRADAEIREMLSALDGYVAMLNADIATNRNNRNEARRQYNSTVKLLFACTSRNHRGRKIVIFRY